MKNMTISLAACTTRGRRSKNQDSYLCLDLKDKKEGTIQAALAVADGLGGEAGGEVASKVAIQYFRRFIDDQPHLSLKKWQKKISNLYRMANRKIYHMGRDNPELEGMGTTFVAALVVEGQVLAANVGDSRIYRIRKGEIHQLSEDHNVLTRMIQREKHSLEYIMAREDELGASLIRSLGDPQTPEVDFFPQKGGGFPLEEGDVYLLCSDGLTGSPFDPFVSPQEMVTILGDCPQIQEACTEMVKLAYRNGSDDNITLVAMEVCHERRVITGSLRLKRKG